MSGASYWYLDRNDELTACPLPEENMAHKSVLEAARKVKLARTLNKFACPQGNGCRCCKPYEAILRGEGELVGTDEYNADIYILASDSDEETSIIL